MPLSANITSLKTELTSVLKKYAEAAFRKTFVQSLNEGHSIENAIDLVAKNFATEFSKAAPDIADLIDKHIKSQLIIPQLTDSKGGPVVGKFTIT